MSAVKDLLAASNDTVDHELLAAWNAWQRAKADKGLTKSLGYDPRDWKKLGGSVPLIENRVKATAAGFDQIPNQYSYEAIVERNPDRFSQETYRIALERLGHDTDLDIPSRMLENRNPPWDRDELILALDLYFSPEIGTIGSNSKAVIALSLLLGRMGVLTGRTTNPNYRNPAGVAMKLMNFRRLDPSYTTEGRVGLTRGNKDEPIVWELYAHDKLRLRATAEAIRVAVEGNSSQAVADIGDDVTIEDAVEGRILTRLHRVRERSRKLAEAKKKQAVSVNGTLRCEACGFAFEARYGERGRGFIEVHHVKPLHTLANAEKTKLDDLALVCANCHRMIHARQPWLNLEELRIALLPSED